LSRIVLILALVILVVIASILFYLYSGTASDQAGAVLEINYYVIDDPQTISVAREYIKSQQSSPAPLEREQGQIVDWNKTDIVVLKITVKLTNNGYKPIYYVTNAFCGVTYTGKEHNTSFEPILWTVKNPIGLPRIRAEKGQVFPIPIACTLDLRYAKLLPGTSISKQYYYIVTKPFKGKVEASVEICLKPLSDKCRIIKKTIALAINT